MKKKLTLIFGLALFSQTASAQNKLQKIADIYKDSLKFYGISALVAQGNTIEQATIGFSDLTHPLKENQAFAIGSITKTFISTIVLKLQEQKLLSIYDHIGNYLDPENKFIDTGISIRQLMNHSSGIKDFSSNQFINSHLFNPRLITSDRDILNQIDSIDFVKGTKHEYSNSNYFLLGLIIEKITDKPLANVISDMIIVPYHLNSTYPFLSKDISTMSHPMQSSHDLIELASYLTISNQCKGAGQMVSSGYDLYTFFKLLFVEKKILNQESLNQMLTFEKGEDDEYGLGIFRTQKDGKDFINHTGRVISYGSRAYYIPQDNTIVVTLTNNMNDIYSGKIKNKIFLEYLK